MAAGDDWLKMKKVDYQLTSGLYQLTSGLNAWINESKKLAAVFREQAYYIPAGARVTVIEHDLNMDTAFSRDTPLRTPQFHGEWATGVADDIRVSVRHELLKVGFVCPSCGIGNEWASECQHCKISDWKVYQIPTHFLKICEQCGEHYMTDQNFDTPGPHLCDNCKGVNSGNSEDNPNAGP